MVHATAALVAAMVSFVLTKAGWALRLSLNILTPGMVIGGLAARNSSVSLGAALFTQIAVDFVFWFTLTFGIYLVIAKVLTAKARSDEVKLSYVRKPRD
jgi:hypothetical protein